MSIPFSCFMLKICSEIMSWNINKTWPRIFVLALYGIIIIQIRCLWSCLRVRHQTVRMKRRSVMHMSGCCFLKGVEMPATPPRPVPGSLSSAADHVFCMTYTNTWNKKMTYVHRLSSGCYKIFIFKYCSG